MDKLLDHLIAHLEIIIILLNIFALAGFIWVRISFRKMSTKFASKFGLFLGVIFALYLFSLVITMISAIILKHIVMGSYPCSINTHAVYSGSLFKL